MFLASARRTPVRHHLGRDEDQHLGAVVGRIAWSAIASSMGLAPDAVFPLALLTLGAIGLVALLNMIAADQGVSMLPEVLDLRNSHAIVTLPLTVAHANLDFTMWAVWRTERASLLVRNFVRLLERNRPVVAKKRAS